MRIFNPTNLIIEVQDRVILPGKGREFPGLTDIHLTDEEKTAISRGLLGRDTMPAAVRLALPTHHPVKLAAVLAAKVQ